MILGSHQSIAGGLHKAFERAEHDTAQSIQIFTRNARGWAAKALTDEEISLFRAERSRTKLPALAHGSYLCNLGSEPGPIREKSIFCFADELSRCDALGVEGLVVHPGTNPDLQRGIDLIAKAFDEAMAMAKGVKTQVFLEGTAGQGSSIGHRFEHLAAILEKVKWPERFGICLDTCHLYAAGYDIREEDGYEATLEELDRVVGLKLVRAFHLNDCVKPLGCRVDRHADVGKGSLGLPFFERLVKDERFRDVPAVLETPTFTQYGKSIKLLRKLAGEAPIRAPRKLRKSA